MKPLKLERKVGVIQESCDNGWVFFLVLCSISQFSLAVLWAFWLFLSHLLYSFCSSPLIPLFVSSVFCLSCFHNFLPIFPLSFFSFPANVLIRAVICVVLPPFSADCWLYKKQNRSRRCRSGCAWVSPWREQEDPPGAPPAVLPSTGQSLISACGLLISALWPPGIELPASSLPELSSQLCLGGKAQPHPGCLQLYQPWGGMRWEKWRLGLPAEVCTVRLQGEHRR